MNLPPYPINGNTWTPLEAAAIEEFGRACRRQALEEAAALVEIDLYPKPLTEYQAQYNMGVATVAEKVRGLA